MTADRYEITTVEVPGGCDEAQRAERDHRITALSMDVDWLAERADCLTARQCADIEAAASRLLAIARQRETA